jgi:hypothetical protein
VLRLNYGFTLVEAIIIIAVLAAISLVGWQVFSKPTNHNQTVSITNPSLLLNMSASGSTNTPPWNFYIYTNGSGDLIYQNRHLSYGISGTDKYYKSATFDVAPMQADLKKLNFSDLPTCASDYKYQRSFSSNSASFGDYVQIIYQGHDLSEFCINNSVESSLYTQLNKVYVQVSPV